MSRAILPVTGPISLTTGSEEVSVVGGNSALSDASDSTYVQNNADGYHYAEYSAKIQPLVVVPADPIGPITLHLRISMTGGTAYPGMSSGNGSLYLFLQNGNPNDISGNGYIAKFTNGGWFGISYDMPQPLDGTIHEIVLPMVRKPNGLFDAAIFEALKQDPYLMVNFIENRNWVSGPAGVIARIYQAWFTYDVADVVVPVITGVADNVRRRFIPA